MSGLPPIPKDLKKLRPYFTLARQIAKAGRAPSTICSWLLRRHAVLTGARMPGGQTPDGRAFILAALQMVETEKDALPPHSGEEELEILQEYAFKNFKLAETPDFAGQANKATAIIYLNAAKMFECLVSTAGEDSQHIPVAQFVMLKNACMSRSQEIVRALKEGRRPDPPTYAPTDSGGGGAAAAPTFGGGGGGGGGAAAAPQFGGGGGAAAPEFGGGGGGGGGAAAPVFGGGGGGAAAGQQPSFSPAPAPQWQSPSSGGSGGGGGGGYVPTFGGGGGGGAAPPPAPAPAPDYETDDIDFFDSLIPAAPTSKPGSGGGNRPSSGGAGGPGGSPPAKPVFRSAPSPSNPPPARQQQQAPSNQPAQHAGGGAVGAAMAAVAKAKASDAARNYGDALEEYKNALSQLLTVNKTPGLAPEQKTQLMGEARHGLTRAEAIKVELTTLPPALPANSLDPLFSVQLPDPSTVRLVSEALNQDLRGNLGNALEVYKRALSSLMGGMKAVAANPQAKAVVVGQLKAYMARAEQLKDWLRARGRSTD